MVLRERIHAVVVAVVHVVLDHVGKVRVIVATGVLRAVVASVGRRGNGRGIVAVIALAATALEGVVEVEVVPDFVGERSVSGAR